MMIKFASWNLCLGIKNKKDYVYDTIRSEKIDICLLQEVEIKKDYPTELLSSADYKIEIEKHKHLARTAIVIKNNLAYERREDLELDDTSVIIIDINAKTNYRIINLYRQFSPPNNLTQTEHFKIQLSILKLAANNLNGRNLIILGDFNLDDRKRYCTEYRNKHLFEQLVTTIDEIKLIQIIETPTWQRIVNNDLRESILDHLYVTDPNIIHNITMQTPLIGDHKLITFCALGTPTPPNIVMKRSWQFYTKEKLNERISQVNFDIMADSVQDIWNKFENVILPIIDELAPYVPFIDNTTVNSIAPCKIVKRKINLRNKLLKKLKTLKTNTLRDRIKM